MLETVKKVNGVIDKLKRLTANLGGPATSKRKLLATVTDSIILYASPIWRGALEVSRTRGVLEACRRKMALRVIRGYRTVSLEAALTLSGMPPIELLAEARAKVYYGSSKEEANEQMYRLWQERWEVCDVARWTHVLIPKVKDWVCRRHGDLEYHTTEFLTGHGPFRK